MRVGALTHEAALAHDPGRRHPERRERVEAILAHLASTGLRDRLEWVEPEPADRSTIELTHDASYVTALFDADARGGAQLDPDTRMGERSLEATLRGSQAAVDATRRVLAGAWDAAFSIMRPPGHHATANEGMGFCLTNHVAVAARWAIRSGAADRVMIVDWDAHHGNGTQDIFWTDPSVLYVSLHQYPFYPGTGAASETGAGEGRGTTLNIPLPAGAGEDAYALAFQDVILPAARAFDPDVTIVSAGYDAHGLDPLCMLRLTAGAYFRFITMLRGIGAGPVCVLEGGYDLDALAWSSSATVSALLGEPGPVGLPPGEEPARDGIPEALDWVRGVRDAGG